MLHENEFTQDGYELEDGSRVPAKRYVNQDGSLGGWVPENLELPDTVFLGPGVIVFPGVMLSPYTRIEGPCVISGD